MPVNPLISLQTQVPDVGKSFSNALTTLSGIDDLKNRPTRNRLLEAQASTAETQASSTQNEARFKSVVNAAVEINSLNTPEQKLQFARNRKLKLLEQGVNTQETDAYIQTLESGDVQGAQALIDKTIEAGQIRGILKSPRELNVASGGLASAKTEILGDGAVIQALPDGTVEVRNPAGAVVTGQERLDTLSRSQKFKQETLQAESNIAITQAQKVAGAKSREARISQLRKEFSGMARQSATEAIKLREAKTLANQASQGAIGQAKLRLAKFFPDIDVSNEGALLGAFRGLALDQLQKFKGPTTDFEFGIAESVSGTLGDPKTANLARIAGLERNNFFVAKQAEQFKKHVKAGGDPEDFKFNFGEQIRTKRGMISLRDLQDTAAANHMSIEEATKRFNQ